MKKYFLSIVALAGMLFATSCQESLVEPQVSGPTTFTVQVPDQMGTKAIGDASIIDRLYVAVYENFNENGGTLPTSAIHKTNVAVVNGAATVALNLIQGQKYDIVFWAQNGESYVDADDELLSIPMDKNFHNNEAGAAFFHFEPNFDPTQIRTKGIELRRPFAQLNLGTTTASLTQIATGAVVLKSSEIKIKGLAQSFNTISGMGENATHGVVSYYDEIPANWQDLSAAGSVFEYVSMDYLPIVGDDQALFDIEANIVVSDKNVDRTINHKFASVPVQENYRTNIVGNLISSTTDFNVSIDSEFKGTYEGNFDGLVVDGATRTITVLNATGLLGLSDLNANWAYLFSNRNGTTQSDYAVENGGKGVDYYSRWVWTIKLELDIDFENETLTAPINISNWGVFDGQGHTIMNVNITTANNTETAAGLFIASKYGEIKNLKLHEVHVTGSLKGNSTAGILASDCNSSIDNITITNSSVWGGKYSGGIVGYGYGSVTNCTLTNCEVKGGYKLGGVIGYICSSDGGKSVNGNALTGCIVNGADGQYAGGKSEYIIGKVVGNFNCNGSCSNNMVANMTTEATSLIGKIEAGKIVTIENNVLGVSTPAQLKEAIIEGGKIELMNDITVDKWIMFSEDLNISNGNIITIKPINVTINGKGHTLTVNAIESAGNNDQLFRGASNLNISDLTIKYADGLTTGGLGMVSGVIKNVHFVGGGASDASAAIFPGNGEIKVEGCTFDTNGVAIYFDDECDNLTVTGCTFNQKANKNVILLRGGVKFTNNIINSGRTVNIVSGSPVVDGNNFKNVRFKVYGDATATVSKNFINNLEFETNYYKSTFVDNTLSASAQAALNNVTKVN
ncbi:MAG: hypothetical protein J6V29_04390 [Bacteroidales bacterium]|nr:hypothetical protein [Bacteroidales bacterium]